MKIMKDITEAVIIYYFIINVVIVLIKAEDSMDRITKLIY